MALRSGAYQELIERISIWAVRDENVRAAVIIGSQARSDHPADEWSDLDIIILATDPQPYLQSKEWLSEIGTLWLSFVEPTPDGRSMEHRVLFAGGLDVDFAFNQAHAFRQLFSSDFPKDVYDVIRRGFRILVDKDNLQALLPDKPTEYSPSLPQKDEFLNLVNNFWYHTLWVAKHLRRGELWWAKAGCDMHLKNLLLQMLQWHTLASREPQTDTWLRGRFLEEWVDPRALPALSQAFAHYDYEDIWQALLATMDLFLWLENETSSALDFTYESTGKCNTIRLVKGLFPGKKI